MTTRHLLRSIFEAALAVVTPEKAIKRYVRLDNDVLYIDNSSYSLKERRLYVLGAGVEAAFLAKAVENILGDRIHGGHVVVKYGNGTQLKYLKLWEAAYPIPDIAGAKATNAMFQLANTTKQGDLVICLLTGGASALTPAPVPDTSLQDIQEMTTLLLKCGASSAEVNTLRKHMSRFSGGQLARALVPAQICSLIMSDVVGDNLEVVASGPTAPDSGTFAHCMQIVHKYHLYQRLPLGVLQYIQQGLIGRVPETPKIGDACFKQVQNILVATNKQALEAAAIHARDAGYAPYILADALIGDAQEQGKILARKALDMANMMRPNDKPICILAGGKTTIPLLGTGRGGRNQEMAMTMALELKGDPRIACLCANSNGMDDLADIAGAYALPESMARLLELGNPYSLLERHASYIALEHTGDLFKIGQTYTNVMDISIVLIHPSAA